MNNHVFLPRLRIFGLQIALILLFVGNAMQLRADQSIILRSGNGPVGSRDAQIRFLPFNTEGNVTPTESDFTAAQTGDFAFIDQPYPTYIQQLPTDPLAHWIGTTNALGLGSALYAIPFMVTDPIIAAASLDIGYSVDNAVNGIYLNGKPISNNILDGDYHGEYYVLRSDIAPLLVPNSINWLYINASDYGGFAGLIFNVTVNIQGTAPGESTISPNQGGNAGQVSVRVIASGFQQDAQIKLTGGGPDIVGTNVTVVSPNILTATLNLSGAAPGLRTVTITNTSEGTSTVLSDAFTVLEGGGANLQIQTLGDAAVDGYDETFFITVTNTGNVDSGPIPVNEVLEPWFTYTTADPTPATSATAPAVFSDDPVDDKYVSSLEWDLPNIGAGSSVNLSYAAGLSKKFPTGGGVAGASCIDKVRLGCTSEVISCQNSVTQTFGPILCDAAGPACAAAIARCYLTYVACAAIGEDKCALAAYNARFSKDPNDLVGPAGYGTQGWFRPSSPFQYALSFSNEATATKPAANVYLTDTFDATKFDVSTLSIGAISLGTTIYSPASVALVNQPFTHDIDLRPQQNLLVRVSAALDPTTDQVSLSFLSLDAATGLAPTDPLAGFLAPGAGGTVLFTVNPKPGFTTGSTFQDAGSVVFDTNSALNTAPWLNTVDITPPESHVIALPSTEAGDTFNVSWTGTDVGSGVADYSIYVSDNGGPFTYWLIDTMTTSGMYAGVVGHTYAFYSIADDFAGNEEAAKTSADTSTRVVASVVKTTTTLKISSANVSFGIPITLTAAVAGPAGATAIPSGTVTFTSGSNVLGTVSLDATGAASLMISPVVGTASVTAKYNGTPAFSSSLASPISVTVSKAATTVLLSTNPSSDLRQGGAVTVIAVAKPMAGTGIPGGTVTLSSPAGGPTVTVALDGTGKGIYNGTIPPPGTYTLIATYNGSSDYEGSVSAGDTKMVVKP